MRVKPVLAVLAAVLALAPAADARTDFGKRVYDILPPGLSGSIPPNANSTDQLRLFDGLTPLMGNVRASGIPLCS